MKKYIGKKEQQQSKFISTYVAVYVQHIQDSIKWQINCSESKKKIQKLRFLDSEKVHHGFFIIPVKSWDQNFSASSDMHEIISVAIWLNSSYINC